VLGRVASRPLSAGTPFELSMAAEPASGPELRPVDGAVSDVRWFGSATTDVHSYADASDVRWGVALRDAGPKQQEVALAASRAGGSVESAAAVLRAAEVRARAAGIVRLVARVGRAQTDAIAALKRAGYYGFAEDATQPGTWICERRIAPYAG
jgi:hypothetical protein